MPFYRRESVHCRPRPTWRAPMDRPSPPLSATIRSCRPWHWPPGGASRFPPRRRPRQAAGSAASLGPHAPPEAAAAPAQSVEFSGLSGATGAPETRVVDPGHGIQGQATGSADNFVSAGTPEAAPSPASIVPAHLIQGDHFDFSALAPPSYAGHG